MFISQHGQQTKNWSTYLSVGQVSVRMQNQQLPRVTKTAGFKPILMLSSSEIQSIRQSTLIYKSYPQTFQSTFTFKLETSRSIQSKHEATVAAKTSPANCFDRLGWNTNEMETETKLQTGQLTFYYGTWWHILTQRYHLLVFRTGVKSFNVPLGYRCLFKCVQQMMWGNILLKSKKCQSNQPNIIVNFLF